MKLRWYSWLGIGVLALLVLVCAAVLWLVNTNAGARWAVARANGFLNDALQIERIDGALAGPLTLTNVSYRDPKTGLDVNAEYVDVDLAFRRLFGLTVHVVSAELRGVDVHLLEPTEPEPEPESKDDAPFTLEAPIDLIVDRFVLRDFDLVNRDQPVVAIDIAEFAGQWIGSALAVRQLDVRSPQGEIHFAADVRQGRYYEGEGTGRFRWNAGERTFAGSLEANARDAATNLLVNLTAPLTAKLTVELQQLDDMPWKFSLDAPRFDPREELLPDSSLQSLAAQLNGSGSLREGTVAGRIEVNQEPIQIERLHFNQQPETLDLDALVQLGGGQVTANGAVRTAQEPVAATMNIGWTEIVVPASLAGQELFTRGDLAFDGSAERYRANGSVNIGPAQRIANLELNLQGTPEQVQVEQLDIVQPQGRFAARGAVELQPLLTWNFTAQARQFDPGAFAVEWPGSLNFDLKTQGTLPEAGPQGTLVVTDLRGRLRNRDLGGRIDLELFPGMVIAGNLDVRSGQSRIRLVGERGETMDAVATIDVPALNDWLPDGSGELHGRITAQGKWPDLNVAGKLDGSALHIGTALRAESLALQWNVDKPTEPSGTATLQAQKLAASGFEFDAIRTQVEGDMQRHTVDFDATGTPLATAFFVEGSLQEQTWDGTIQRLVLDVQDAARLALQAPAQVHYSPERVELSQACLADGDIRLCLQATREASGVMHAVYSLNDVPLGMANAFLPADMPLSLAGALDGNGEIDGNAEGALSGHAEIRSANGRISRQLDADADPDVLLTYDDLNLTAQFDGGQASAQLAARLDETGALNGRVALQGLNEAATSIDGELSMNVPSLRVIEVFAPQLINVQGRAELAAAVRGALDAPQVSGEFRVADLGMDVPVAGLRLREGGISVTPIAADRFRIAGGIRSGDGRVEFEGAATTAGEVEMTLAGKQFLAADIPSANVIIEPDLAFNRTETGMRLTGSVHLPKAAIDIQKLPQNQRTQGMSSDVVIVDAQTQEEAQAEALPLVADIKVTFGDEVTLVGYGLDARIAGQLGVKEQPGSPTSGSGEVRVEGTYKAYGQDLTIRQGQLLFAGTPLDNPRLSIVAVREVDTVTAGLRVSGSAQNPILTVFSEPAMGQSDALAYIVTGKPLSEVGQGDADEGDMLQSAARSLGTAAGGLIAKNIGQRLGVDEFGIKDSSAIGGAALTVGQYLSPRLYLSYGVGLFEPGEVITLRYKLTRSLAFEALNGPQDSRAGVEYRMER